MQQGSMCEAVLFRDRPRQTGACCIGVRVHQRYLGSVPNHFHLWPDISPSSQVTWAPIICRCVDNKYVDIPISPQYPCHFQLRRARPNSSTTAERASAAAARSTLPTSMLRMMPEPSDDASAASMWCLRTF